MKKFGMLLLFVVLFLTWSNAGQAAEKTIGMYLDDQKLELPENVQVEIVNNSVMLPIRFVVEKLGFYVEWIQSSQTVKISKDAAMVELVLGQETAVVNGAAKTMLSPPYAKSQTTMVPLRFISEELGLTVMWNAASYSVSLNTPPTETVTEDLAHLKGISFEGNRLTVQSDKPLNPNVFTLSDPNRIVMDIPHAEFDGSEVNGQPLGANQTGQLDVEGHPIASKIRYSLFQNDPSTIRIVMDLNQSVTYQVYGMDNGTEGMILELGDSQPTKNGKKLVVLDAGHGDDDPGAISVTGQKEKDFNLKVALKVQQLLQQESNIEVVMTRHDDTFLPLAQRAGIANDLNADAFVSIHANSAPDAPTASGTETYYYDKSSLSFAQLMHKHLLAATEFKDRKVKFGNLSVLRNSKVSAVLLEIGFLSNKTEEAIMMTDEFQNRVAEGIANGIKQYVTGS
ncbi:N-acetylmuramoyl-L-alanine amidase [Marinicrinis lubricantis]|uniref:N-acetylmuramoyl-L-alanine amidase n=1 Tax=Marinicrinis lubricantis TaxID=2086470 RepID=A0ABW1INK0_9BACL